MVLFNYSTKELTAKIVYYGPGLCGKTTNLQYIHQNLPQDVRGKMLSLATKTDRTLFFDFLPIDLGSIRGMKTRVQLYTVPGQVFYNETRKLVLKGADGIVFVADSQEQMLGANVESFKNLEDNLKAHGMSLADMPHVIQFNKRDLPKLSGIEDLNTSLNKHNAPFYESVATTGIGVQDTLKAIVKLVLLHLTRKYDPAAQTTMAAGASPAEPAAVPAAAPPAPAPVVAPPAPSVASPMAAAGGGIPLSDFETPVDRAAAAPPSSPVASMGSVGVGMDAEEAKPAPPPPPDFRGTGMPAADASEAVPRFGDDEIDDLVDEVDDVEGLGLPEVDGMEDPLAAAPTDVADVSLSDPAATQIGELPDSHATDLGTPSEMQMTPPSVADDGLQVDRGFDPEWDRTGSPPHETPQEVPAGAGTPDDAVLLTEVAADSDLFDDPDLEVARLGSGTGSEIVVPVQVGEGPTARRYKLSIRLRLDSVD